MLRTMGARASSALLVAAAALIVPSLGTAAPTRNPANGAFAVRVTASGLNVRASASTNASVIGVAESGQIFAAVARSGDWYQIHFDSRAGWCHGSFLVDASNQVGTVTASSLNVRTGPGTGNSIVGQTPNGRRHAILATQGGWHRIQFGDRTGWVSGSYLSTSGKAPAPTPQPGTITHGPASAAGFIQLPAAGPGFYNYSPSTDRWGKPKMIYGIERVARRWSTERPAGTNPRLGVGDISLKNGGYMPGHASHRRGVDADFRLARRDGVDGAGTRFQSTYSRAGTQLLVRLFRAELPVTHIFFNDPNVSGVSRWPNHDNHFHVRISG